MYCFAFEEKHTAQNLATILENRTKHHCVCDHDNGTNIISAVRESGWKSISYLKMVLKRWIQCLKN